MQKKWTSKTYVQMFLVVEDYSLCASNRIWTTYIMASEILPSFLYELLPNICPLPFPYLKIFVNAWYTSDKD